MKHTFAGITLAGPQCGDGCCFTSVLHPRRMRGNAALVVQGAAGVKDNSDRNVWQATATMRLHRLIRCKASDFAIRW